MSTYSDVKRLSDNMVKGLTLYADMVGTDGEKKTDKYGFTPGLEFEEMQKYLLESAKQVKDGIFQVMFTGQFNAGKSTLLNALMHRNILATAIKAETAIITKIIFNQKNEKVIVVKKELDKNGNHKTVEMSVPDFFKEYKVSQTDPEKFINTIDYAVLHSSHAGFGDSTVQFVDSPGTQQSAADNEVAHEFIKKANAIVFLINATAAFTKDDKDFIQKHFAGKEMKNLFFIINRFDCISESSKAELMASVREQLKDVFSKADGRFDEELFQSRVFYTSASLSVLARTGQKLVVTGFGEVPVDDNQTGVPEFEAALAGFLSQDDKYKSAFDSYLTHMARIYTTANEAIEKRLEQFALGIDVLRQNKEQVECHKNQYEMYIRNISECCNNCVENILTDAKTEYDNTINRISAGWTTHFRETGKKLKMKDTFGMAFNSIAGHFRSEEEQKQKMEKIMQPFADEVTDYVKPEYDEMGKAIQRSIENRLQRLAEQLNNIKKSIEALDAPVSFEDLSAQLAGMVNKDVDAEVGNPQTDMFQMLLGIIAADPETFIGGAAGVKKAKSSIVVQTIVKQVFEVIAFTAVAWPIGLAMLAVRGVLAVKEAKDNQKKGALQIFEAMKEGTLNSMRSDKDKYIRNVESNVSAIMRAGNALSNSFQSELDRYLLQLEETIQALNDNTSAASLEKERTDNIKQAMVTTIGALYQELHGKALREQDIAALV